jgi:rod shape determining protein RodA
MKQSWLRFDFILFFTVLALLGFGLAMIYSTTLYPTQSPSLFGSPVFRQGLVAAVGVILILILTFVDYGVLGYHPLGVLSPITRRRQEPAGLGLSLHHEQYSKVEREPGGLSIKDSLLLLIEGLSNPFYVLALALLFAVSVVGKSSLGAQRWIDLRFFDLQPSEVAKLMVIIALARYLADHEDTIHDLRHLLVSIVQVAIPVLMIARQPDLGTALTIMAIWLAMVIMAGIPWRHLLLLALSGLAALPVVWTHWLSDYQRERLLIFMNPQLDPLGAGYNLIQSRISVGAGGLLGRGLNSGTQSQLNFLRIQHTDYIFSVLAEELGFIGAALLIALYCLLIMQALTIAANSRDTFGRLIASGVAGMIVFQVFVNIGMNIGLSPVTGIPLPFISYGRSSLFVLLISMGILESIAWRRKEQEHRHTTIELEVDTIS